MNREYILFKFAKDIDINQVSSTGVRGIVMLGLLLLKPRSLDEIKRAYIDYNLVCEKNSDDIIRIDLNTLKHAGCEISRIGTKNNYKFVIEKHPFALDFSENEILLLKKVYNKAKKTFKLETLIEFDNFFIKLANYVQNDKCREQILGISDLKYYNKQIILDLLFDCSQNYHLEILYQRPSSNVFVRKKIIAQKLVLENGKIYLYGYDKDKKTTTVLNLKRIKEIISRLYGKKEVEINLIKVKFQLKKDFIDSLRENEKIISEQDDFYIIEAEYYDKFIATQRILSFGKSCTVIGPDEFREYIIAKIKKMRDIYGK